MFCSISALDRTLSGATTQSHGGPGKIGNEGVLNIPQNFNARTSPSDGFILYVEHWLWGTS